MARRKSSVLLLSTKVGIVSLGRQDGGHWARGFRPRLLSTAEISSIRKGEKKAMAIPFQ